MHLLTEDAEEPAEDALLASLRVLLLEGNPSNLVILVPREPRILVLIVLVLIVILIVVHLLIGMDDWLHNGLLRSHLSRVEH